MTLNLYDISMWIMEFLVLILIAYEVAIGYVHRAEEKKRQAVLDTVVSDVSKLMEKGQRLQSTVPDPALGIPHAMITNWMESANRWAQEVDAALQLHSQRASAAFSLMTHAGQMDSLAYASARNFVLTGELRECYQRLVVWLENLRRIIERPEAYF